MSTKYFNPVPMFILFRETIEASIVVSVLLTFLREVAPQLRRQVWWGVGLGVTVSLILAAVFAILYYEFQSNVFQGKNQMIFNGVIFWVAAIFVTYLAFAMLRYKGWEEKWKRKLAAKGYEAVANQQNNGSDADKEVDSSERGANDKKFQQKLQEKLVSAGVAAKSSVINTGKCVKSGACSAATAVKDVFTRDPPGAVDPEASPRKPWYVALPIWCKRMTSDYTMFLLVFFTVLREGVEAVVFLFGVGNTEPAAIPISGIIGIICGLLLGFFIYYTGRTIKDIRYLLFFFAVVLFFIAAGAASNGAHLLMQGGMFGPYYIPAYPEVDPNTGAISSTLYGGEGQPPAPSADALAAGGFNDGDEVTVVISDTDDGYYYHLTTSQPWWQRALWDICTCCSDVDTENYFLSLCSTLFGYRCAPCFIDAFFYLFYWFFVVALGLYKYYRHRLLDADWKHTRMLKQQTAEAEAAAATKALEAMKAGGPCAMCGKNGHAYAAAEEHAGEADALLKGAKGGGGGEDCYSVCGADGTAGSGKLGKLQELSEDPQSLPASALLPSPMGVTSPGSARGGEVGSVSGLASAPSGASAAPLLPSGAASLTQAPSGNMP